MDRSALRRPRSMNETETASAHVPNGRRGHVARAPDAAEHVLRGLFQGELSKRIDLEKHGMRCSTNDRETQRSRLLCSRCGLLRDARVKVRARAETLEHAALHRWRLSVEDVPEPSFFGRRHFEAELTRVFAQPDQ